MKPKYSIVLTIHNKQSILEEVLNRIYEYSSGNFELVFVLDGCTDESEDILMDFIRRHANNGVFTKVVYTDDVFETKANNAGLKKCSGEYSIIVQDDMFIDEAGWNENLCEPFKFEDVFAVSGRCAHNWIVNEDSKDIKETETDLNRWSDALIHVDHAKHDNSFKGTFYIRDSVNRGPLAIKTEDLKKLGYFDEIFAPQDSDDHDLMFRAKRELGKICGYYKIDWFSRPEYGGTRDENGVTKRWMLAANQKNAKILLKRHGNFFKRTIQQRKIK